MNFRDLPVEQRIAHLNNIRERRIGYIKDAYNMGKQAYTYYKKYAPPLLAAINQ